MFTPSTQRASEGGRYPRDNGETFSLPFTSETTEHIMVDSFKDEKSEKKLKKELKHPVIFSYKLKIIKKLASLTVS